MTAVEVILDEIRRSPRLRFYVDELTETLRREEAARKRFRESLDEDVRAEFINGEVVIQLPSRDRHTLAVKNIVKLLDTHVTIRKAGAVRSEQALVEFSRNDYAPDVCYWRKTKSKRFTPDQMIYPPPDLVCEVLSPSTAAIDRGVKLQDYEAQGVGEYWIVDPQVQFIEQYVLRAGQYELVGRFSKGVVRCRVVKGFQMSVRAAFDDVENLAALKRLLSR